MELFDKASLERRIERGDLESWKATRYRTFREAMTDKEAPFLCYFAVEAQREGYFRYVFPESSSDGDALNALGKRLAEFLDRYEEFGEYTSLVVLFRPPKENLPAETYKRRFWNVLGYLQ